MKKKDTEQKQENPSFFKELGSFMQPYKLKYALSVILSIIGVCANLASYAFAGLMASQIFSRTYNNILIYLISAVLCKISYALLLNLSTWCSHKAAYKTLKDLRHEISRKMLRLPLGYFESNGSGRLNSLFTDEIENMEKPLAHVLPEMTADLLAPSALIIWMFFIDWRLALCTVIWIILGFSVTGGMMKNYPEKFQGQLKAAKNMQQNITEYVRGIEVIKNFGQSDASCKKYEKAVNGHAEYNVNWQKETLIYSALGMAVAPFSIFPVLIAGLIFFNNGTIDASSLFLCILLTLGIFGPLMQSMNYFDQLAQMGTNAKEIKDILDYPELKRGNIDKISNADIIFDNVSFSYDKSEAPVLKNISLKVPAGTMLALVGPSGSGKSTIAKLLAGYWDADSGSIKIGNNKLSDLTQECLNSTVAFVDQDTFLFNKSILDNIRIAKPGASDEDVIKTAKAAGCHEFINNLPEGYETKAGSAGNNLSGGQKQRIAIARAMMKQSPVMILDEATASSDPENEALIQKALSAAAKDKTLIVIAHHLSTIINAEQIAYVEDGEIKCTGTHEELLSALPQYKKLWELSKEG